MTSRFKKMYVCPSVYNANKNPYSAVIINSRIIIRLSGKTDSILYKKMKQYFQNIYLKKI